MEGFSPLLGLYTPRVRRDLDVVPRGISRHALAPQTQPISKPMGVGFPHLRAGIDRGMTVFVPSLLELLMYGRIYDPGMGTYPPRMRRDLDVVSTGNFRCALAP